MTSWMGITNSVATAAATNHGRSRAKSSSTVAITLAALLFEGAEAEKGAMGAASAEGDEGDEGFIEWIEKVRCWLANTHACHACTQKKGSQ